MRRVEGRMAHLADRLLHRRSEFFDNVRARRERRAEPFRVRWYRFTDSVGVRWERLTDKLWTRPERPADPFKVRWYRFTDLAGERLTDKLWARPERLSGERAERSRQNVARRSPIMLGAILSVMLMVAMTVLIDGRAAPAPPPNDTGSVKPSRAVARGIDIPDVRGMPASDARAQLERAGLKFAGARAALGAPGRVLWTQPNSGLSVPFDTPVTIVIGVEVERLGSASRSPLPSAG